MALAEKFQLTARSSGGCWLHKEKPAWVVHYPQVHPPMYQAYVPTIHIEPHDQQVLSHPWTVDNMRLSLRGYPSLEEAMQAANDWEWK